MRSSFRAFFLILALISLMSIPTLAVECIDCHSAEQEAVAASTHSFASCVDCHLGQSPASSLSEAHDGVLRNPALLEKMDQTCGNCHGEIVKTFGTSLHATVQGLKHGAIAMLGEEKGTFVGENRCGSCHATCIDCHLEKDSDGKILASHQITSKVPSQNCKLCHDQTGTAYVGAEGHYPPSVHAELGMACGDCHNGEQVHGTGEVEQHLSEVVNNKCEDCHTFPGTVAAHKIHEQTLDCSACHVSWYYNCYTCHGYDENGDALGYDHFNTNLYLAKRADTGKIGTVVHIPMSEKVGGEDYVKGAWVFKNRHSIQKNARSCQDCHLNAQPFVMDNYREAPFLGAVDGEFLSKSKVTSEVLIFRSHAKIMGKPPKAGKTPDSECLKCHGN